MSHFKLLYQELVKRLVDQVGEIKYIDQDLGQLEVNERPPVRFPCVLIDLSDATFDDVGENYQLATVSISLRLGFAPFTSANSIQKDSFSDKALQFYDIEAKIHKALHGHTLENPDADFRELTRVSASTEQREPEIRVRQLVYNIEFEDDTTKDIEATTNADLYFKGGLVPSISGSF